MEGEYLMSRLRFPLLASTAVVAVLTIQAARCGAQANPQSAPIPGVICTVYPLGELAEDASLAKWIAETIPEVIQPGSWNDGSRSGEGVGARVLKHHAAARVLVVYHTPAVQAQVDAFLKDLKKSLPQQKGSVMMPTAQRGVVPAQFSAASAAKIVEPAPAAKTTTYLVPAPQQQPKHLFHLILRYEGEGISDSSMVSALKSLTGDAGESASPEQATPEPGKTSQQAAFNFILRYEGEGIIDSNVVEVIKAYIKESSGGCAPSCTMPTAPYLDAPPSVPAAQPGWAPGNSTVNPGAPNRPSVPTNTSPVPSEAPRGPALPSSAPATTSQPGVTQPPATQPATQPAPSRPATTSVR
jgi:hypothetical protein